MRPILLATLLTITFPTLAHARAPATLWTRPNLTAAELDADGKTCLREASAAERNRNWSPPNTGGAAGAFAGGLMKGASDMDRFNAAHKACGERLGYVEKPLSPDDRAAFDRLRTPEERTRFILDFSARATAAPAVETPPVP